MYQCDGMTLVELMVSICVTMLVATLSISIFTGQYKSYVNKSDFNEIQEAMPPVVELIKRELMEAGWAVRPQMAFYFEDGGANGCDQIYINDVNMVRVSSNNAADLTKAGNLLKDPDNALCATIIGSGSEESSVTVEADCGFQTCNGSEDPLDLDGDGTRDLPAVGEDGPGHRYLITDALTNKIARITATTVTGNQATLNLDRELSGTVAAPAIHYCVDDGSNAACDPDGTASRWVLRRSDRNSEGPLAANVVDLQVAYRDRAGTWYGIAGCTEDNCVPAAFNPSDIDLIRHTLVTRTGHQDGALRNNPKHCRPAVENRAAAAVGSEECGYTYRTFVVQVTSRNN